MRTYRYLLSVFLAVFSLHSQQHPNLYTPFQRDVAIFIDWDSFEESIASAAKKKEGFTSGLPAVSNTFGAAVYNASVPIIVSASLLDNLVDRAQMFADAKNWMVYDEQTFTAKYTELIEADPYFRDIDVDLAKVKRSCIAYGMAFDSKNRYISKKIQVGEDIKKIVMADELKAGGLIDPYEDPFILGLMVSYLIIDKINKNKDNWIMRKDEDDCVYIMIPKLYLEGVKDQVSQFNKSIGGKASQDILANSLKDKATNRSLDVDEIVLGIKFKNFPEYNIPTLVTGGGFGDQPIPFVPRYFDCREDLRNPVISKKFINKQSNGKFGGTLSRIIINAQDFTTFSEDQYLQRSESSWVPQYYVWNIYGVGHGNEPSAANPEFRVMGLDWKPFSEFLGFFDSINTKFLMYDSCFAGGKGLQELYMDKQIKQLKTFSYTIAIASVGSLPVLVPPIILPTIQKNVTIEDIDVTTRSIKPRFPSNFGNFFNDLHALTKPGTTGKKAPISYKELFLHLIDFMDPTYSAAIPQIRFASSQWFNVIDLDKIMVRLTRTFVRAKAAEIKVATRPEDKQFILRNKKLLLIDAETAWGSYAGKAYSEVPFPIVIHDSMPTVISMVVGDAWHSFEKIDAGQLQFTDVINNFSKIGEKIPESPRTYFIKELIVQNNLTEEQKAQIGAEKATKLVLKNVCILANAPDPTGEFSDQQVIFQYNNKWYSAGKIEYRNFSDLREIPDPGLDQYQAEVKKLFGEPDAPPSLEEIAQFIADRKHHMDLVKQYENKKANPAALEAWRKTLSEKDRKFIENYEAMEKARSEQPPASKKLVETRRLEGRRFLLHRVD